MRSKTLKKAEQLFKAGKYSKVLLLLESQVFRYRQSFDFFYLLGISCLHSSDYGGGYSYLQRAIDLKPDDVNTLAGLAVVHLKRQESSESISRWFEMLDIEPNNKIAKRGLEALKKNSKPEDLMEYISSERFLSLLPDKSLNLRIYRNVLIITLIAVFCIFSSYYLYEKIFTNNITRPEIAAVSLNRFGAVSEDKTNTVYTFSDKEIRKIFETIRKNFENYNDNLAMRDINKLLLSNADNSTKAKIKLLTSYIRVPNFTSLKTNFTYQDFIKNPKLYNNCYINWKGRLSNLVVTESLISFDFLVGYDDKKVLEGIIPVTLKFGARINSDFPIEVLGKIVENSNIFAIEAVSVHQFE